MLLVRGLCLSSLLIATRIIGFVAEQGESMSSHSSTAPIQLPASKLSAERVPEHPKVEAEIVPHEPPHFPRWMDVHPDPGMELAAPACP